MWGPPTTTTTPAGGATEKPAEISVAHHGLTPPPGKSDVPNAKPSKQQSKPAESEQSAASGIHEENPGLEVETAVGAFREYEH